MILIMTKMLTEKKKVPAKGRALFLLWHLIMNMPLFSHRHKRSERTVFSIITASVKNPGRYRGEVRLHRHDARNAPLLLRGERSRDHGRPAGGGPASLQISRRARGMSL